LFAFASASAAEAIFLTSSRVNICFDCIIAPLIEARLYDIQLSSPGPESAFFYNPLTTRCANGQPPERPPPPQKRRFRTRHKNTWWKFILTAQATSLTFRG
jgi:hypothetical protein